MASRAPTPLENEDTIRESCAALAGELLNAVTERMNSFLRDERCHTLVGAHGWGLMDSNPAPLVGSGLANALVRGLSRREECR